MVKKGHNYGKKTIKYGGRFLKTRATPLYPVGFSVGMGRSIIGDVVIPEVAKKISNQSTSN
ncbi:hypothetical protein [Maridesulfovibrio sp.]|uniref:hypothetical protein n=1 Tax=Maridesulfovibrio sp. TaxID=2795000 RepID=UPI002A18D52A|nr:hypothetical protein [Maridesulfovibrio sp.]